MARITLIVAVALVLLGMGSWLVSGQSSLTALIPAVFGFVLGLAGIAALRQSLRKVAMHIAALVSLLGAVGSLGRALPSLDFSHSMGLAAVTQLVMGTILLVFLVLCVRSFIRARNTG